MNVIGKIMELDIAQGYLLTSQINVMYASGFTGDSSELLITGKGAYFFTDSRYTLQAHQQLDDAVQVITTSGGERNNKINDILRDEKIKTLAIEKTDVSMQRFDEFEAVFGLETYSDVSDALLTMRAVKSDEEIRKIETASDAAEDALGELVKYIKAGVSELELRTELIYQINKRGMDIAFEPIVAGGANSALPHAQPTAYRLQDGDLLTLDFGCRFEGYCSDMTRTFGIGQVDGELKKIYDIVKQAQQNAVDVSLREKSACAIDAAARDIIAGNGYGKCFGHGTGHGVGLEVHERPVINPQSSHTMQKNMVYTVEPGIYIAGLGGVRIEDTCVYGRGSINHYSKELVLIQ